MGSMFLLLLNSTNNLGPYDYEMALDNCLFCLRHASYLRSDIEEMVLKKLRATTTVYERDQRFDLLFHTYEITLKNFPTNQKMVLELANHLMRLGYIEEAKNHYEYILQLNERDITTNKYLLSLKCMQVERWHFKMLNDQNRNETYKKAIQLAFGKLEKPINMLDIGTGTGLFSLIGSHFNIKKILACEKSQTMFKIAQLVFKQNLNTEQMERVTVVNTELAKISKEHEKSFNIIITELFDAGVFGEHVLEVLIEAHRFLTPTNNLIIPYSVKGYLVGISSDYFTRQFRLTTKAKEKLKLLENFHLKTKLKENYDCDDCKKIKFYYMTNTVQAFNVNFNDYNELIQFRNFKNRLNLNVTKPGPIDAFMLYFKLNLIENSNLSISTNPTKESCWDQAIFFNECSLIKQSNETIEVDISYQNEKLSIHCINVDTIPVYYELNECAMLMLNDLKFIDAVLSCQFTQKSLQIFDAMPFPLIGIIMVLKQKCYLTCYKNNKYDNEKLLRAICLHYDVEFDDFVKLIDKHELENFSKENKNKFDYVFVNYFHKFGMLNENVFKNAHLLQILLKNNPNSIMLPKLSSIKIFVEIVFCPWFRHVTEVNDRNLCGFKIADVINEYQIDEHFDFKIDSLQYQTVTGPVKLRTKLSLNESEHNEVIKLCRFEGKVNAILYWFEYKLLGKYISTRTEDSYVNNAAMIFRKDIELKSSSVRMNIQQGVGLIKMSLCET